MCEEIPTERQCTKCLVIKPLGEFTPNKLGKFGRMAMCKKCRSSLALKRYNENIAQSRDYHREYQKAYREKYPDYYREYQKANREKLSTKERKRAQGIRKEIRKEKLAISLLKFNSTDFQESIAKRLAELETNK